MKIVKNSIIPFGTYVAMTIGPWIFTKREKLSDVVLRHEAIHWEQQKELAIVGFYILYVILFVWELFRCLFDSSRGTRADGKHRSLWKRAYRMNALEREAYAHENTLAYQATRRRYAWAREEKVKNS